MLFAFLTTLSFALYSLAYDVDLELKYGHNKYIKYEVGTSAVILTAGHGGLLEPKEFSLRENGCYIDSKCVYRYDCTPKVAKKCKVTTVTDSYTIEITEGVAEYLRKLKIFPHVIINSIKRTYIDMNRPIDQACGGRANCEQQYNIYHNFIREARESMKGVVGLYIDIHGQKHSANWTELGYRVSKSQLNSGYYENVSSSIDLLRRRTQLPLKTLLTGGKSFGAIFSKYDFKTVPSPKYLAPGNEGYYRGGYCTKVYGSASNDGNCTDAIQIELPKNLRFGGDEVRGKLIKDLAESIEEFMTTHQYGSSNWKCSGNTLNVMRNFSTFVISVIALIFICSLVIVSV